MNIRTRKFTAVLSLLASTAAFLTVKTGVAQTPAAAPETAVTLEKFEVTGSMIKVSELVGPSPVDIVNSQTIRSTGVTDVSQLLKKFNPDFQGNGNVSTETNNGGGGESYVALRNLTTLVLVNGRRMTGSPFQNGALVDLNTIPLGMIDRIEILKDGASTLYGSDAIAGVVNVILKKDYNGFEASTRYGMTGNRDYTTLSASLIGGVSKEGTSITVGLNYYRNDQLSSNARSVASLDVAGLNALGASSALPSYYSGSYQGRVGNYILAGSPLAKGAPGYNASLVSPPAKTNPNAPAQTIAQLNAAGIYISTLTTPLSVASGGGVTILNTTQFGTASIVPTDRRQFVLNGEHEIYGKSLVFFADGLYAETINNGTVLAPSPLAGVGANSLIIPANNPYNLFGINIGLGFTGDPGVRTRLVDIGNRYSNDSTETYRLVAGLKGDINENYSWQIDSTYSRATATFQTYGGANGSVMNQLLKPLLNSAGTAYVYDSSGRPLSVYTDASGNNLPVWNYFSVQGFQQDPRDIAALSTVLFQWGTTQLNQFNVLFRGTPFDLPAGKLAFATGLEYRRETLSASVDGLYAQGLALGYGVANTFSGGSRSTRSAFAEVDIPVFGGSYRFPGAYLLDLSASGRYEKLSSNATDKVPKLGFKWQPLDRDLTIRGTYAKGFIAPTIYSLYGPAGGNSPTFTVPLGTITSSGGAVAGKFVTGQFGGNTLELSNPSLQPSNSISRTLGIVYSPKQIKGLAFNADYYFVKEDKVGGIDYTGIYADLNAKGSASQYASTFIFADGSKLTSTAPNQITSTNIGGIAVQKNPSGEQYTDGLDLGVNYEVPSSVMQSYGKLTVGANANVLFNYKFRPTPTAGNQQYARQQTSSTYGLGGANGVLPGYKINYSGLWQYRGFNTSLLISYIPTVVDAGSLFAGQSTTNAKTANGLAYTIPSYTTVDLSVGYAFTGKGWYNGISLVGGVNNLTNKLAPYIPDGNEDNTDKRTYDIIGRFYFLEVSKKF
jgi:iron complex outermembrane receptor protein